MRKNYLTSQWAKNITIWNLIKRIYEHYDECLKRKRQANKMMHSAMFIISMARRYYSNTQGQSGRTYEQRIQIKIGHSLIPLYFFNRDQGDCVSKQRILRFLETMACRNKFCDRILKVTKGVKML